VNLNFTTKKYNLNKTSNTLKMTSLFSENRQVMMHVVAEVAAIGALAFYFHKKNKVLQGQLNELYQQVQSQQELIEQHDQVLKNIVRSLANQSKSPHKPPPPPPVVNVLPRAVPQSNVSTNSLPVVDEQPPPLEDASDTHSETASDLDAEIAEELADLVEQ
jgi:hypothetical protein